MKSYKTKEEILELVQAFENGTISRHDWQHAEHLTVACFYVLHQDLKTATNKMRLGIFKLLKSFDIDLSKEMPYHETLTCFWMQYVSNFVNSKKGYSIVDLTNSLIAASGKDLPLEFYSRELLFSDQARAEFVSPDLKELL